MRTLSIFVDESGDFGKFEPHSPFYILCLVFHDSATNIDSDFAKLHEQLARYGLDSSHALHSGPLIRRELGYTAMDMPERRSLFRLLVDFARRSGVQHQTWIFDKRKQEGAELTDAIFAAMESFLTTNYQYFERWDRITVY